jgi:hypothetical protein
MTADVQAAAEVRPSPQQAAAPGEPSPASAAQRWPARARPTVWPQTLLSAEQILARGSTPPFTSAAPTDVERRRGARKLLAWLASFPGQTWQERWLASGAEQTDGSWLDLPTRWLTANWPGAAGSHRVNVRDGNLLVLGGAVIRPSYAWLLRQPHSRSVCAVARQVMDPDGFNQLERALAGDPTVTTAMRQNTIRRLTWIVLAKGGAVADITVGDLLELLDHETVGGARATAASLSYRVLRELGVFPVDSPPALRATRTPGPRSVAELVDQYQLACRPVRDLLVDYLSERTAGADYSTRRQLVTMLAGNFWADLERHHPGIDALRLPAEVAAGWKQRLRHIRDRDGRPVRERVGRLDVLINVRSSTSTWPSGPPRNPPAGGRGSRPARSAPPRPTPARRSRTARPAWTSAPANACRSCPPRSAPPSNEPTPPADDSTPPAPPRPARCSPSTASSSVACPAAAPPGSGPPTWPPAPAVTSRWRRNTPSGPGRRSRCCATPASAQPGTSVETGQVRRTVADCDRRLARHRAALEAGADPALVAQWTRDVQAERLAALAKLRASPRRWRSRLSEQEIEELINALGGMLAVLADADAADKAEAYRQLGLQLTYDLTSHTVLAEASPRRPVCAVSVSEGGLEPPRPLKGTSTSS